MPAEPLRKAQPADNRLYVLPPWAARPARRRPTIACRLGRWLRSDSFRVLAVQVQVAAVLLALGAGLYAVLPELYRLKSEAGIDLFPGVHGPDVLPFLAGR